MVMLLTVFPMYALTKKPNMQCFVTAAALALSFLALAFLSPCLASHPLLSTYLALVEI